MDPLDIKILDTDRADEVRLQVDCVLPRHVAEEIVRSLNPPPAAPAQATFIEIDLEKAS